MYVYMNNALEVMLLMMPFTTPHKYVDIVLPTDHKSLPPCGLEARIKHRHTILIQG